MDFFANFEKLVRINQAFLILGVVFFVVGNFFVPDYIVELSMIGFASVTVGSVILFIAIFGEEEL